MGFALQKWFKVPSTPEQTKIPFARVNHNKYMVTDNAAYIGKEMKVIYRFIETNWNSLILCALL
jgi:phospholipase D3/4